MRDKIEIPSADQRVAVSLFIPILIALIVSSVVGNLAATDSAGLGGRAVLFGGVGMVSWLLGQRWYGIKGMGLRGKRPMFSGAGFAFLGWVALLLTRFYFIETEDIGGGLADEFFYFLLFEAFAVQLWLFGVLFHSLADWRGGLTAVIISGILFGAVGFIFFLESTYDPFKDLSALLYFVVWGVFYGIIRLRTGSIVGIVLVQAMQSLTAWHILVPKVPTSVPETYDWLYLIMGIVYIILIWRLWPKEESDYRI